VQARTGKPFNIFQDVDDIKPGDAWRKKLDRAIQAAQLFIPILTPSFFTSEFCRREAQAFLDYEARAERDDLVLPIYLIDTPKLDDANQRVADDLASRLHERQYEDWRSLSFKLGHDDTRPRIYELAGAIAQVILRTCPTQAPQPTDFSAEHVNTQQDNPALVDELGRRPFAEVIAHRIEEVWKSRSSNRSNGKPTGAFTVHIEGPWGAGKTSLLNFLRAHLQEESRGHNDRWIFIDFNAWQHQRIRPPWWTLIKEIYLQSVCQIGFFRSIPQRFQWWIWRAHTDWLPLLFTSLLIVLAALLATGIIDFFPERESLPANGTAGDARTEVLIKSIELGLKILTTLIMVGGAVFAMSRSLLFGSARAAQAYTDLQSDPLRMIIRLFQKLVRASHRPVLIFIDDLDRCEARYVIELLEGIQTLFKTEPVTYVVAADRKWICSSFEQVYEDFAGAIGVPGRPLGYHFLDKIFQVSVSVPNLLPATQRKYWSGLLATDDSVSPDHIEQIRIRAEERARKRLAGISIKEDMEAIIATSREDPLEEQALRAAAARQITRGEAEQETEHRLEPFAKLLEPNPRSMKRLVNAVGLHQAKHFIEGRNVSLEALVRWTIIELRWPLLAEILAARPQLISQLLVDETTPDESVPEHLRQLFGDAELRRVIAASCGPNRTPLDDLTISQIVGLADDEDTEDDAYHAA